MLRLALIGGLPRLADAQLQFDSWTTESGLPQTSVNDIVQTSDGYLWLATIGGLVRFDGTRFVVFDRSTEGIGSQRVRTLREDSSGSLWVTWRDTISKYDGTTFVSYQRGTSHTRPARAICYLTRR